MKPTSTYHTDLIARYFFGEATPEEVKDLEAWVKSDPANASVFSESGKTWRAFEQAKIRTSVNPEEEWTRLASKLKFGETELSVMQPLRQSHKSEIRILKSGFLRWTVRIAAIFLLVAIPSFFIYQYFATPVEKQLFADSGIIEQTLPDGTVVTLNSGATLSYPSGFKGSFREVTLHGEAWFEVAHDKTKPFIVTADNIRIRVVGTSFSVNTNTVENTKEVILSSGIVKVYDENHPEKTTLLLPGEKAEITAKNNTILKTTNDDINFLAWKTKHLVFNNTPLNEVSALLTKVYCTNIRLSDERLSKCTITATFDKQSLESVLNVLKATLDLHILSNGAGFDLSGQGCDQNK
jgi:ferric-dicitrate binding protein FerR (iron transport regulator)